MKNKNYICHMLYLRDSIWSLFLGHLCTMMISLSTFPFFWNFDFLVVSEVKGQRMTQKCQKFCLSCAISQEPYITWMSFLVNMCKIIISLGIFFIFYNFDFLVQGEKKIQINKNSVCQAPYLRNHTSYGNHLCYTCLKW